MIFYHQINQKLLKVLNNLVDRGNTVIIIEHNMDVIKSSDWIIDMGPEGGDKGGFIVASGTPEKIIQINDIPYTINGKKVELAVKQVIQNIEVKNNNRVSKETILIFSKIEIVAEIAVEEIFD